MMNERVETETYNGVPVSETEAGNRVTNNGRWPVRDDDVFPGDRIEMFGDDDATVLVVALPTGPVEERDPGIIPGCSFCNHRTNLQERKWESVKTMVDDNVAPAEIKTVVNDPDYGVIQADYALVDTDDATVRAYSCHCCLDGAEVVNDE